MFPSFDTHVIICFLFVRAIYHRDLLSFPTRRSSDLIDWVIDAYTRGVVAEEQMAALAMAIFLRGMERPEIARRAISGRSIDRKSTRLNSSHVARSYAVFCLKKKIVKL